MEEYKYRLSIVIPMYNASSYIKRCLDSCLNQNLNEEDLEIVVVNDGSKDNCAEIVETYQQSHSNIHLFHQDNAGAGMARNKGLFNAHGKYVMFVDSDDYLISHTVYKILQQCEKLDLDLCKYQLRCIYLKTGEIVDRRPPVDTKIIFSGEELLCNPNVPLDSACASLYKHDFLIDNGLSFSGQTSSEDVAFNTRLYPKAKRIMFSELLVYVYEVRVGSRRHSEDLQSIKKYTLNNIKNAGLVKSVIQQNPQLSDYSKLNLRKRANSMMIGELISMFHNRHILSTNFIEEALSLATREGVYPINGHTFSWKTSLLIPFINCKSLYKNFFNRA